MIRNKTLFNALLGGFLVLLLLIALTSCSTVNEVAGRVAELSDEALNSAEFTICEGATVGSVKRRYDTPEKVETWRKLCEQTKQTNFTP